MAVKTKVKSILLEDLGKSVLVTGLIDRRIMKHRDLSHAANVRLFLFFAIGFTRYMGKKTRPLYSKRSAAYGEMNGFAEEMFTGQKTIYIVVTSGDNVYLDAWQATEAGTEAVENVKFGKPVQRQTYDLSGRRIADGQHQRGIVIEQYTDERGVKKSRKHL